MRLIVTCPICDGCDSYDVSHYDVSKGVGINEIEAPCRHCGEMISILYNPEDGTVVLVQRK